MLLNHLPLSASFAFIKSISMDVGPSSSIPSAAIGGGRASADSPISIELNLPASVAARRTRCSGVASASTYTMMAA